MAGKTVIITGFTQGIGRETATGIGKMGAKLVLVSRDPVKSEKVAAEIRAATSATIDVLTADLASQASIRTLAATILARYPKIDVLLNNAGGIFMERIVTSEGLEQTFALNHLGYFLLTNLLLDRLKASAPARIVNVSSAAHESGHLDFDDLQSAKKWSGVKAYSNSKLCNILFTKELARRLAGSRVTVNCLHPGVVATGFGRNREARWLRLALFLAKPFLINPAKGAETSIHLATSPEVEGVTGTYFAKSKETKSTDESNDASIAKRLWDVSETLAP